MTISRLAVALFLVSVPFEAVAGDRIYVPVRWCGVEGAPSMVNPAVVNEATTDNVLWRRHERPTDRIYQDDVDMTFRSGATNAIRLGPVSFPIIRDPRTTVGNPGDLINGFEHFDAIAMCRRAWTMGDPLYFEQSNNGTVNDTVDTLLSTSSPVVGLVGQGHDGAPLVGVPGDVRYVDVNTDGNFDIGERIYRDENTDGVVDGGDTLLVNTDGVVVGVVDGADVGVALVAAPSSIKYLDLIREPANTYNIGYPQVKGITSVNANDVEVTSIMFPVHGNAASGIGGLGVVMDDSSQYLPPGPDFILFETQLVAHEFGHSLDLSHGDGIDDDMNGVLDDADDGTAPVPGAGPGTECTSNNVMSYCWLDNGTSGNPMMAFIGMGSPTEGSFTPAQSTVMRDFVVTNVDDHIVDPVIPPLAAARVDALGEVDESLGHVDITDYGVKVESSRMNTSFVLNTRRPLPDTNPRTEFHFLLDIDGNSNTGGDPAAVDGEEVKTEMTGAEYVAIARFRGREPESVKFFRYMPVLDGFERVQLDKIRATMVPLTMTPDFPMGRRAPDPDGTPVEVVEEIPVAETVTVIVPLSVLLMPTDNDFRVEYIAKDLESGKLDRAGSPGMSFELPVFPDCHTDPATTKRGESVTVFASGLLPDREVHLLLGADELQTGMTDANGSVKLTLPIPADTATGNRLVTVGALAVSADCNVYVEDPNRPGGGFPPGTTLGEGEACCRRLTFQLWIIIVLLLVAIVLLWRWWRR